VKTALLRRRLTITDLGRKLSPVRPRSTLSRAIHGGGFPKVKRQIEEALGL